MHPESLPNVDSICWRLPKQPLLRPEKASTNRPRILML